MSAKNGALHMVQFDLNSRRLFQLERELKLPSRAVDLGYLVHCELGSLFGDQAPAPFHVEERPQGALRVLGYTTTGADAMLEYAERFALPDAWKGLDRDSFAAKPMPSSWPQGLRLQFRLRAAPVVRKASAGEYHRKGAEIDAFLARCWQVGAGVKVDREQVYAEWLRDQIERHGGAAVDQVGLLAFRRSRLLRRTQGASRQAHYCERPDALMEGRLVIRDGERFSELVARGIGRHRGFGFGMLLLSPERATC